MQFKHLTGWSRARRLLETGLGLLTDEDQDAAADPTPMPRERPSAGPARMLGDFGDYELLEEIGRGGQGVVYRAHQKSLNRTVALKVIGLGPWATEAHLKRFRREAEAAASLNHPFIVPIHEVGERDGYCYFSMNFVESGQLDEVVKHTPMLIRQAAELVAKVARTVHYAHEHGILHRDIKPGNILLDAQGEPHLTDFGLARLVEAESTVTRTLEVMGTPSYMAPEQAAGEHAKLNKATDVYGLGAVLYQSLTGHPPFAGGTTYETIKLVLESEPRQPRLWNRKIDRDLSTICLKCLEKDPKRRYPSALALAEDLEHWLKHEPIQAKPSGFFTHSRKWVRRNPSTALSTTLLVVFAIGLGVIVWNRKPPVLIPKSVALLPFENLSDDPDNAYFAEGIQEEILTRLASIADLKVISRTSTQRYHSRPGNLAEIAKQLGVANILEGSVQKAGDRVRVNVQLINAQSDSHLWADSYDRKLTDVFGVESEIAKRIAESLQAKLTGREEQALAFKPTSNPEAYDAYVRGLAFDARRAPSPSWEAPVFYERAVQLDPNFALAWARLSRVDAHIFFNRADATAASRGEAAKHALQNAQKLEPNSPETLLALGYYQYWVLRDYGAAKTTFGRVSRMLPGSSEVPKALGSVVRREGHWDESIAYFEQALALDPRNVELLMVAAETYSMVRQFPAALKLYDRVLDIMTNDPEVMAAKAGIYQAQGNLQEAARFLSEINWQTPSEDTFLIKITQLRLERNYGEVIRLLQARQAQFHYADDFEKAYDQAGLAFTQRLSGDTAGAKVTAEQARNELEQLCKDQPDNDSPLYPLSQAYAALGEMDSALKTAERAIMLLPRAKDAVIGPRSEENLALIQAIFGENSRAISTLTDLLKTPYRTPVTPALLRLDPIWDPLRSDPAFQKLCEEKIDKSIAVLPFENLSEEKANAYFAEGIQDEILTRLSKIADLKVISRTSTRQYQAKPGNLDEIAKQLGVAHVLEGSVQRAANKIRVNAQLIDARNDTHLWAQTYDGNLPDVFAIQSEIAKAISDQLQAKLSPDEKKAIEKPPTTDLAAFDLYSRAKLLLLTASFSVTNEPDLRKAIELLDEAVKRDPSFFDAYCQLAFAHEYLYGHGGSDHTPARLALAEVAVQAAIQLRPDAPETHLARAQYLYYGLRDYAGVLAELEIARRALANDPRLFELTGYILHRRGQQEESLNNLQRAVELDPRNLYTLQQIALIYQRLQRYAESIAALDRALAIVRENAETRADRGLVYLFWKADTRPLHQTIDAILAQGPGSVVRAGVIWFVCALAERDPAAAERALVALGDNPSVFEGAISLSHSFGEGLLARMNKDDARARTAFEAARTQQEKIVQAQPDNGPALCVLGLIDAALGRKDVALDEGRRAIALTPLEKDVVNGTYVLQYFAITAAWAGEKELALQQLEAGVHAPVTSGMASYGALKLFPVWDPLRSDPRFEKIVASLAPK